MSDEDSKPTPASPQADPEGSPIPVHSPKFEKDGKWIIASCPEFQEANGQGRSQADAAKSPQYDFEALEHDRIVEENVTTRDS